MKKIIFLGAGGNASVIYSTIIDINKSELKLEPLGFLDDNKKKFHDLKNFGKINNRNMNKLLKDPNIFFIWTLISSKFKKTYLKKLQKLKIPKKKFINIFHPQSNISNFSKIGKGVTIHAYANIGPNTKIGDHVHIFSQASIGHDTSVGNFSYLAGKSSLGANITIAQGCFFGINSSVRENLKIKKWSTIGMGSVVINNVEEGSTVVGNPAKKIKG
jgi:acetyltransferase EpsM